MTHGRSIQAAVALLVSMPTIPKTRHSIRTSPQYSRRRQVSRGLEVCCTQDLQRWRSVFRLERKCRRVHVSFGKSSAAKKPNQKTGIRLHAASGKVSSQSQTGATHFAADQGITVASVTKGVTVAAKKHVLLTVQGAYIKLSGGNIEVHGPGTMAFKASSKELAGAGSAAAELPALPHPANVANSIELNFQYDDLEAVPHAPYIVTFANGAVRKGTLDEKGHAVLTNVPPGEYTVEFGEDPRDWSPPPEPEPDYKKPDIRAQAERAIQQARAAYERGQA